MLHPDTVSFLKKLAKNNNKPWFDGHKAQYIAAKSDFENFVREIISTLSGFDSDINDLLPKQCTFRINRDIRFSKDKTPYKSNMGASFIRGGKKSIFAGYYFHLAPGGKSFVGGGLWMPEPEGLKKLRQEIDYCFAEFTKIITGKPFRKQYSGLEMSKDQLLVNVPKGYDKHNPAAEVLKLKNFVAMRPLPDALLTRPELIREVEQAFRGLMPLVKFINRALE